MNKEIIMENIGTNLREYRKSRGLTQEELAKRIGISTSYCANLESGKKAMSIFVLYGLINALSISADDLLFGESPYKKIHSIEFLLNDKPEWFLSSVEKMVCLFVKEFLH